MSDFFLNINSFRNQNYKHGNTETKSSCYNWLINYFPEINKKQRAVLKIKSLDFVKQTQLRIIVNQCRYMLTVCINVEINQKTKNRKQSEDNNEYQDRITGDIRNFLEQEKDYCKLPRAFNFWSNKYIECKSNGDRNKTL